MKIPPILFFLLFPLVLFGQEKNIDENLLAVARYDQVSYFTLDNPQQGREVLAVIRKVARYLFASKKNKAIFKTNTDKYLPACGGWFAYAMIKGREVDINPKAYHIQQGQLNLFYKTNWVDTRAKWLKDEVT